MAAAANSSSRRMVGYINGVVIRCCTLLEYSCCRNPVPQHNRRRFLKRKKASLYRNVVVGLKFFFLRKGKEKRRRIKGPSLLYNAKIGSNDKEVKKKRNTRAQAYCFFFYYRVQQE